MADTTPTTWTYECGHKNCGLRFTTWNVAEYHVISEHGGGLVRTILTGESGER